MPKKYRVKITRHAESDIESIFAYIHGKSPQAAIDFISELERQISSVERFPLRCPVIPEASELGIQYRHLLNGDIGPFFEFRVARITRRKMPRCLNSSHPDFAGRTPKQIIIERKAQALIDDLNEIGAGALR